MNYEVQLASVGQPVRTLLRAARYEDAAAQVAKLAPEYGAFHALLIVRMRK